MWSTVASVRSGIHDLELAVAEHGKRLRTGDFVDQVLADKELRLARRQLPDGVGSPRLC